MARVKEMIENVKKDLAERKRKRQISKNCIDGKGHRFEKHMYMVRCKKCSMAWDLRKTCPYCDCCD